MKTVLTTSPNEAAEFIKRGGIVAFPTETVYGLGANIFDEAAIAKIFEAKRRPADNPLIAHVCDVVQIEDLAAEITGSAEKFIRGFFPGPLTVVLRKKHAVPMIATAGLKTIGIRMPKFETANQFLRACGVPVAAPSANISGRPSPTTWEAVVEDLDGRIDCILQGEPTIIGLESTVVDCTSKIPIMLRPGSISLEQLRIIFPETQGFDAGATMLNRSPGLRHAHYSPKVSVVLVDRESGISNFKFQISNSSESSSAYIGIEKAEAGFALVKICPSAEDYAHSLFEFFRECDRQGIQTIYCEAVAEAGIGAALMDRLRRAAAG